MQGCVCGAFGHVLLPKTDGRCAQAGCWQRRCRMRPCSCLPWGGCAVCSHRCGRLATSASVKSLTSPSSPLGFPSSSWRNDVDHDHNHDNDEVMNATIQQYYKQKHEFQAQHQSKEERSTSEVQKNCTTRHDRSESPTSTLTDVSRVLGTNKEIHKSNFTSSSPKNNKTLRRSVSWKAEVVTDVIYRPRTKSSEKRDYFYNSSDMHRFRQHYRMQVRAAQEYQKRCSNQQRNNEVDTNSAANNAVVVSTKKKVIKKRQHQKQQHCRQNNAQLNTSPVSGLINMVTNYLAKPSTTYNNSNSVSRGQIAETCVLVDTLYLF